MCSNLFIWMFFDWEKTKIDSLMKTQRIWCSDFRQRGEKEGKNAKVVIEKGVAVVAVAVVVVVWLLQRARGKDYFFERK